MSKLFKFLKENKIVVLAFIVIALSFGLFAIPGQFVKFSLIKGKDFEFALSGYEFIFGVKDHAQLPQVVCGQGIAIFVMLIVSFIGCIFVKKSSFIEIVTGLVMLTVSILFFTISVAGAKVYPQYLKGDYAYTFVPYLLGGLIVVSALLLIYEAVKRMKDEVKHPAPVNKGPTYNYLHK